MDEVQLVSWLATVFTIALFSSGILTSWKVHVSKSVGSVPYVPFLAAIVNCSLWMTYGLMKPDSTVLFVNLVGLVLNIAYTCVYHTYTEKKFTLRRDCGVALCIVLPVTSYFYIFPVVWLYDPDINYLGIVCNIFTILFFASPLSTMADVIKTRSTQSMSFVLSLTSMLCTSSWTLYGVLVADFYMILPNGIGLCLSLIQLSLFAIYKNKVIVSMETPV